MILWVFFFPNSVQAPLHIPDYCLSLHTWLPELHTDPHKFKLLCCLSFINAASWVSFLLPGPFLRTCVWASTGCKQSHLSFGNHCSSTFHILTELAPDVTGTSSKFDHMCSFTLSTQDKHSPKSQTWAILYKGPYSFLICM